MPPRNRLLLASLFSSVAFCLPSVAVSQEASPYLPINWWGMPYVEHLIASGRLADPSPLSRPFKVDQVVRAIEAIDSTVVTGAEWSTVKQIRADLTRHMRGPSSRI